MFKIKLLVFYHLSMLSSVIGRESGVNTRTWSDRMGRKDKDTIKTLCDDLMKDAILKMRQLHDIREEHEMFVAFNIGIIIGRIGEKFRVMVETYRDIIDKESVRWTITPPGIDQGRTNFYIIALEMIHYQFVEIDKLIHVLEATAEDDFEHDSFLVPLNPNQMFAHMRTGPQQEDYDAVKQQMIKSQARQEYLMKKIGQPPNMTTIKKRFLRQWPVEDTWSFEKLTYE